jgi:hypothetical protein
MVAAHGRSFHPKGGGWSCQIFQTSQILFRERRRKKGTDTVCWAAVISPVCTIRNSPVSRLHLYMCRQHSVDICKQRGDFSPIKGEGGEWGKGRGICEMNNKKSSYGENNRFATHKCNSRPPLPLKQGPTVIMTIFTFSNCRPLEAMLFLWFYPQECYCWTK